MKTILAITTTLLSSNLLAQDFTLHEWGTFTTVIGSDGTHLDGVHREDAPLPKFVYQLDDPTANGRRMTKGLDLNRTFKGVNVRLETPVLYFYTNEKFEAQVDVGFNNGTIGQWFPDRSTGEKRAGRGELDLRQKRTGSIRWNVTVEPAKKDQWGRVFQGGELPCWLFPRQTDSALVTNAHGETDKYLFYRGLGRFGLPVAFSATDKVMTMKNVGGHTVPAAIVFEMYPGAGARWWKLGAMKPGSDEVTVKFASKSLQENWRKALYEDGVLMLVNAGLYRKEADAMMQTWWDSYFETRGLRVFWIVPRETVDEVLPLAISPKPEKVERVIVGRSEILRPGFESALMSAFVDAKRTDGTQKPNQWLNDRFYPAYLNRINQIDPSWMRPRLARARPAGRSVSRTWNDCVSSMKISGNIRILAYEDANFEGECLEVTNEQLPVLLDHTDGLKNGKTWNDRISSLRVLAKDGKGGEVELFENSRFAGRSIRYQSGTEIENLTSVKRSP